MRLGMWREALALLARAYPQPPPEQAEPGVPLPQQHPLVAYYRAFCRQKLGEPAAADYDVAAKLPTAYVFPHGAQTLEVLESRGAREAARCHGAFPAGDRCAWPPALSMAPSTSGAPRRRLTRRSRCLQANLGRVLLRLKRDVPAAAEAFRAGLARGPVQHGNLRRAGLRA